MNIGLKIKKLREQKNLSQELLAIKWDISQSKLSDIENGRRKKEIDFILMNKICDEFEKDFYYFTCEEGFKKSERNKDQVNRNAVNISNYPHNILEQVQQLVSDLNI